MDLKRHITALLSPLLILWTKNSDSESSINGLAHTPWIPAPLSVCLELQVSLFRKDFNCYLLSYTQSSFFKFSPLSWFIQVLKRPLRLASLTLDPVWLLLSVHSSMRLYIALDRSPLQFTQFCRRSVFTTSYNLGHTLSMHYLSGAIFGAGTGRNFYFLLSTVSIVHLLSFHSFFFRVGC